MSTTQRDLRRAIKEVEKLIFDHLTPEEKARPGMNVEIISWDSSDPSIGFRVAEVSMSWGSMAAGHISGGCSFMQLDEHCWKAVYAVERAVLERLIYTPDGDFDDRAYWDEMVVLHVCGPQVQASGGTL